MADILPFSTTALVIFSLTDSLTHSFTPSLTDNGKFSCFDHISDVFWIDLDVIYDFELEFDKEAISDGYRSENARYS